ncbi:flavin-dependent oxidoreductase [Streptomyces sp. NPDC020875]|uniref:flavin-dependent oxidoreductase n=1 Tax=Streptomyces sp. NPDC020875 TaxID=3154898 RepID=UPI0033CBB8FF
MTHFMIAGGGIAGLTTALALHRAGFTKVTVVEAAREIRPVGAGLNILPNAVRELDELGLLDALSRHGLPTRELRYYHRGGGLISSDPRGIAAGYRWPQLSIGRGALQVALADAVRERLGPEAVVPGVRVAGIEQQPHGRPRVRIQHRDGVHRGSGSLEPDVLIGADGIRSAVRAGLNPDEGEPPWNGLVIWRGVSRVPAKDAGTFMFIAGDDRQKAVVYPLAEPDPSNGTVLMNWALAVPGDDGAGPPGAYRGDWNRRIPAERCARHFAGWEFDGVSVERVVAAAEQAYEYPMVDREPLDRWSHGRTTLVGDAAHAMYPAGSNGATQSVVDARALARALSVHRDPAEALAAYEAERRPAMTELQRANRSMGPEIVINLAHERAPDGFTDIDAVIPPEERARITARYEAQGAFAPPTVNRGSPYTPGRPPSLP